MCRQVLPSASWPRAPPHQAGPKQQGQFFHQEPGWRDAVRLSLHSCSSLPQFTPCGSQLMPCQRRTRMHRNENIPGGGGRAGRVPGDTLPWQKLFCFACKQHTGADVAFNPSPGSLSSGCRMGKKRESDVWLGRKLHAEHFAWGFSGSVSHTEPPGSCQQTCSGSDSVSGGGRRLQAACGPLCPFCPALAPSW